MGGKKYNYCGHSINHFCDCQLCVEIDSKGAPPSQVGPMASTGVKPTSNMPPPVSDPTSARRPRSFGQMHNSVAEHVSELV